MLTYDLPDDPYAAQLAGRGAPSEMIGPKQVTSTPAYLVEVTELRPHQGCGRGVSTALGSVC